DRAHGTSRHLPVLSRLERAACCAAHGADRGDRRARRLGWLRETFDAGANASVLPAMSVASLVGFGAVVAALPAFAMVRDLVLPIEGGPLVPALPPAASPSRSIPSARHIFASRPSRALIRPCSTAWP